MSSLFDFSRFLDLMPFMLPISVSPEGEVGGLLAKYVVGVEVYRGTDGWEEYWYRYKEGWRYRDHVRISTRIIEAECARIYARRDGALIVSFDCVPQVVVIRFRRPVWELLGFESFSDLSRAVIHWIVAKTLANYCRYANAKHIDEKATIRYLEYLRTPTFMEPYCMLPKINRRMIIDSELFPILWFSEYYLEQELIKKYKLVTQRIVAVVPRDRCIKRYKTPSGISFDVYVC